MHSMNLRRILVGIRSVINCGTDYGLELISLYVDYVSTILENLALSKFPFIASMQYEVRQ